MMLVSEKEARGKICGPVRQMVFREADQKFMPEPLCHGTQCMHWRWPAFVETNVLVNADGERAGYCGLSGKPEVNA